MTNHTILVAFVVEADTMKQAQELLMMELPRPQGDPRRHLHANEWLQCWWIAEDERYDGSDNDSAVFQGQYHQGDQVHWREVLTHLDRFVDALGDDEIERYCSKYDEPGDDYFDEAVSELIGALRDALEIRWQQVKENS